MEAAAAPRELRRDNLADIPAGLLASAREAGTFLFFRKLLRANWRHGEKDVEGEI